MCPVRTSTASPGLHLDTRDAGRAFEVVGGDRVVVVEVVDAVQARDVEQHAARHDRADVLDPSRRRAPASAVMTESSMPL